MLIYGDRWWKNTEKRVVELMDGNDGADHGYEKCTTIPGQFDGIYCHMKWTLKRAMVPHKEALARQW